MLSCSIWFPAPSFWIGGGLERRCVPWGLCREARPIAAIFRLLQFYSKSVIYICLYCVVIYDTIYICVYIAW